MIHTKPPYLVCLDFKAGIAARYVRQFDVSGAGLGWRLARMQRATFDPAQPLTTLVVERFREAGQPQGAT